MKQQTLPSLATAAKTLRSLAGLVLPLLCAPAFAASVTFTASGNWTAPAGVTSVTVEAWGGGGGGGAATGRPAQGGGGGGGQYAIGVVPVTPGNTYAIAVGVGGTGGNAANGGAGGNSSFNGTVVVANGGAGGGLAATNNSGGTAGAGSATNGCSVSCTVYAGGNGSAGTGACSAGAGGGGAGSTGPGGAASGLTGGTGTPVGGGNGGAGRTTSGTGNAGAIAGGAGGGACATTNTNRIGGAGARGQVVLTYASIPTATTNAASAITAAGATLNGTVSSNGGSTTVTFEYGLDTSYGNTITAAQSPLGFNAANAAVSATLTTLNCGTTYHFRVKAANSAGTAYGSDLSFSTSACISSGIVNTYYPGVGDAAAGTASITLGPATGASAQINAGDTLLILQMQDAEMDSSNSATYGSISSSNAGRYEYAIAANSVPLSGGTLSVSCGLLNSYSTADASASSGQSRFQVIRVPTYPSTTLTSTLTAAAWNGSTGGVLALDAAGAVNLGSATVSVDGLGFRGGAGRGATTGFGSNTDYVTPASNPANGSKGEGIGGTPDFTLLPPGSSNTTGSYYPNGSYARGAPGNGGGGGTDRDPPANDQNSGGGGGGNGGMGGIGGIGWCPGFNTVAPTYGCGLSSLLSASNPGGSTGGLGGNPVGDLGAARLTMGGGGGAGTSNNSTGTYGALSSSGAAGGGIIMVRAGSLSGTGTFNANGSNGDTSVRNDGSGGGGGGGAVMVSAGSGLGGLTINANGGSGGSNLVPPGSTATPHGPGGGGGGGVIMTAGAPAASSAIGGSNGVTYNNGVLFTDATGSYGATPGSNGVLNSSLVAASIPGIALGSTACAATVNHFAIDIGGSTGSTCVPKNITITAQNSANGTVTNYTGLISITTSPAHGDWSKGTPPPLGILTPGATDSGVASYQFMAGDNGVANFALSDTHADGGLIITVSDSSLPGTLSVSSPISFSDNAFVITNDAVQVAGRPQAMSVAMWRKDPATGTCSIAAAYTGAKNLKTWLTVDAADPGGAAPTIGALSLPNSQPASSNLSLTFAAGTANFSLGTSDVGKYALNLLDDSGSFTAAPIGSSTSSITTRPFALVVGNIAQGTTLNPANRGPGGAAFAKAGSNFQATVGAYLWNGAADADNNGLPDAVATLAQITANGATPSYAWPTLLAAGTPYRPATPADTPAGSGVAGSFGNGLQNGKCAGSGTNCFTNGIAVPDNLNYSEVGSFTLSVGATDFLNTAGADLNGAAGNALVFDNSAPPQRDGVVGRFIPDHFAISANAITNRSDLCPAAAGCPSSFTYMSEAMNAAFALSALAAGGTLTQNYTGGFAKLNPAATGNPLGFTAVNDTGTTRTLLNAPRLDTSVPATGSFSSGTAIITAPLALNRGAAADGPYTALNIGIAPIDSDGVTTVYDIDTVNATAGAYNHTRIGATSALYGQVKLSNNHGSELLPLPLNAAAQYWNGTAYAVNGSDSLTSLALATSYPIVNNGSTTGTTAPSPSGSATVNAGSVVINLSAPGSGITGTATINPTAPAYLPVIPGYATFGTYRGNNIFIYQREQY